MYRTSLKAALVLLTALVLAAPAFAADYEREFSQSYPLGADGRVSLENINGDAVIEAWDRDEVLVEARITARTQEALDRVEIQVDASGRSIEIETEYEEENGGWNWKRRDHASVDYTIYMPRDAALDSAELVNGDLEVSGLRGDVHAELVNGDLEARDLGGNIELETVNGDVEVEAASLAANARVNLESVNGDVVVNLAGAAGVDVRAETVHGDIDNDFGFEVKKDRYVGQSLRGTLGSGELRIELETVNGDIRIRS